MKKPTTAKEVSDILERASIDQRVTLTIGILLSLLVGIILTVVSTTIIVVLDKLPSEKTLSFVALFIVCQIISFGILFVPGLRNVPLVSKGLVIFLGQVRFEKSFRRGGKAYLQSGWHWILPGLFDILVFDIKERSVSLEVLEVVVPNKEKRGGLLVVFKQIQVNFLLWDLFAVLRTGEADIDKELILVVSESIRDQAVKENDLGPESVFCKDINEKIKDELTIEEDSERWGILVLSVKIAGIGFKNLETEKSYESFYNEKRQQESEAVQSETIIKNTKFFIEELGVSLEDAIVMAQRISKLYGNDILVTTNGSGKGLVNAAAALAALTQK